MGFGAVKLALSHGPTRVSVSALPCDCRYDGVVIPALPMSSTPVRSARLIGLVCCLGLLGLVGCVGRGVHHKARGNVLFHNGDIPGAITEYRAAIAAAPGDANAYTLLGNALFEQAQYEPAAQAFKDALARDPQAREARRGLATCQLRLGHPAEAEAGFTALVQSHRGDYEAEAALGKLLLARGDLDGAEQHLGEALRWVQNDPPTLYALGLALARKKEQAQALEIFGRLDGAAPGQPYAAYGRAVTFAQSGRKEEALQWLGRALERGVDPLEEVMSDPDLASLRDDPRLGAMVAEARKRAPPRPPKKGSQ